MICGVFVQCVSGMLCCRHCSNRSLCHPLPMPFRPWEGGGCFLSMYTAERSTMSLNSPARGRNMQHRRGTCLAAHEASSCAHGQGHRAASRAHLVQRLPAMTGLHRGKDNDGDWDGHEKGDGDEPARRRRAR